MAKVFHVFYRVKCVPLLSAVNDQVIATVGCCSFLIGGHYQFTHGALYLKGATDLPKNFPIQQKDRLFCKAIFFI